NNMSLKVTVGMMGVAALAVAGGAYYWLHSRPGAAPSAVSAENATPTAPTVAEPNHAPTTEPEYSPNKQPSGPSGGPAKKDPTSAAPSGLPVAAGEILDFSADVAKVSSVATLRLQTAEKRNFQGKSAWHLQAFAHTQNPLRMVFQLDDQ